MRCTWRSTRGCTPSSYRDVAAQTDISASLLTKIKHGSCPDADNLVTLLVWLGRDVADFTVLNAVVPPPPTDG